MKVKILERKGVSKVKKARAAFRRVMMFPKKRGFPTLEDLRKTVPRGGLLSPSLRKGNFGQLPSLKDIL